MMHNAYEMSQVVRASTREPLKMEEIKDHLRIGKGQSADDTYLAALRVAVRRRTEELTGRAIMKQTRRVVYHSWSTSDSFCLPYPPSIALTTSTQDSGSSGTSLCYKRADTRAWVEVDSTTYAIDTVSAPGRLVLDYNSDWPTVTLHNNNPIRIHYTCGYSTDPAQVPGDLRLSMLMSLAHWYENREEVVVGYGGIRAAGVPAAAMSLLQPYRVW